MKSILYIVNSHFWKSITGPFFAFVFPIIFIVILGPTIGFEQILGGVFSIPVVTISLVVLPIVLFEFKSSSLLKRIGITSIKSWMFMVALATYYICIMLISTVVTIILALSFFSKNWNVGRVIMTIQIPVTNKAVDLVSVSLKEMFDHVNWGGFVWGILMSIITSLSFGLCISCLCKSTLQIQGITIPVLIITEFLAAQVLPIGMVRQVDFLYYASYICPLKYSTGLMVESWNGTQIVDYKLINESVANVTYAGEQNIFNVHQQFNSFYKEYNPNANLIAQGMKVYGIEDKILNLVMPFIFTITFSLISLRKFKWSARG